MAVLAVKNPTLMDAATSMDPDGKTAAVVELLSQTNPMLDDMTWIEGNLPTGHKTTIRTGLPSTVWRQLYQGVPASKSTRAQVTDTVGMLEARSEVDKDLAELNGNNPEFRLSEGQAFLEKMSQDMTNTVLYGDVTAFPERFTGFAPRYSSLSAGTGKNIIDAGGTGSDNTSIWLVVWGPNTVHGIYPKGSRAGLQHEDLGLGDAFDGNGDRFRAYMDHWQWKGGLSVRDWRYVVRIANIDVSNLTTETGAADLVKLMIRAKGKIPFMGMGRPVFYANSTIKTMLEIQALAKSNNALSIREAAGQFDVGFFGIPIKQMDAVLNTEGRVV